MEEFANLDVNLWVKKYIYFYYLDDAINQVSDESMTGRFSSFFFNKLYMKLFFSMSDDD